MAHFTKNRPAPQQPSQSLQDESTMLALLTRAVTEPGTVSAAYAAFHDYSLGNQLLALSQILQRGLPLGPLATFNGWKRHGRRVQSGEKAIWLVQPVPVKKTEVDVKTGEETARTWTLFRLKPGWFTLAQTEGEPMPEPVLPDWDAARALAALDITEKPFDLLDGNTLGYAVGRTFTVSPVGDHQTRTRFHEIAHIVLGHTAEHVTMTDDAKTPRSLREVEAEGVAFLLGEVFGLPHAEQARGYVQHWMKQGGHDAIPEASARKIFKAVDQILKAGYPAKVAEGDVAA